MIRREDLTGKTFGRLKVAGFSSIRNKKTYWSCRCECGNDCDVRADQLKDGTTRSCGCFAADRNAEFDDLTGRSFGRLTVIGFSHRPKKTRYWACVCKCGSEAIVPGNNLVSGKTKSCGCFHKERAADMARAMGAGNITHGMTKSREYEVWHGMKQRCLDAGADDYKYYGAKGVSVCERWLNSFENFYADMGPRPSKIHQIDRRDPYGNYEPSNCRWVTPKEQQRNRRQHHLLTYKGETKCLSEWAETVALPMTALWQRIQNGWPIEKALTTPLLGREDRVRIGKSIKLLK